MRARNLPSRFRDTAEANAFCKAHGLSFDLCAPTLAVEGVRIFNQVRILNYEADTVIGNVPLIGDEFVSYL